MSAPVRKAVWCAVVEGTQDGKPATMAVTLPPEHRHNVQWPNGVESLAIDNVTGGGISARVREAVEPDHKESTRDGYCSFCGAPWPCEEAEYAEYVTARVVATLGLGAEVPRG